MTSRERVLRCIRYEEPDRCPMSLPEPYPNDLCRADITPDPDWKPWQTWEFEGFRQWEDEWHNIWRCLPNTDRGEVIQGVLQDWSQLETYQMPRLDLPIRYQAAEDAFASDPGKYHLGTLVGFPFAVMRYMRGMEDFLADVLLNVDEVNELQRRVVDLLKGCLDQWAVSGADGVLFHEDWGTQERLLVSPACWHEIFEPGYRELAEHARTRGVSLWMHSCGYIKDIIPTLLDIGIEVLQLNQPGLSGLDYLAKVCHGRAAVWSPADIQLILPTGDESRIRAHARELIDKLGSNGGGFICGHYRAPESIGIQPEWQMWAADEFSRYSSQYRK